MDFTRFEGFNYLKRIVYITELKSCKILWMNRFAKQMLQDMRIDDTCHKFFYGSDTPCKDCRIRKFREENNPTHTEEHITFERILFNEQYTDQKIIFLEDGKYYTIDIIIDEETEHKQIENELQTMHIYENLLSKFADIQVNDSMENIIQHIISSIKDVYQARRVTMIEYSNTLDFKFTTIREDNVPDFYYNPILKDVIAENPSYAMSLKENKHITIHAKALEKAYPAISKVMLDEGDENLTYMEWVIDQTYYKLVIENAKIELTDKEVYKLIHSYLYFILSSFYHHNFLYRLSNIDSLTGVYNRNKYNQDVLDSNLESDEHLAVIYLDLDNLKHINDAFGHSMGDKLLINLSKILRQCFKNGNVYRLGGDEFVVIISNVGYKYFSNQIETFVDKLKEKEIHCSFGVNYQESNAVLSEMLVSAEKEMYIYKRRHHEEFSYENERNAIICQLKEYIKNRQFYLVLQPKIDPYKNEIVGAEALVRGSDAIEWQYPNEFIPLFERNNCIDIIDCYMLEEACKLQKYIIDTYHKVYPISVNISRSTFLLASFEEDVKSLFTKYDIPVHSIHLEITERMDVSSEEILLHGMRLKKYGLQLEVDDFGSHFTNLSFLSKDVFSVVKLDRTLLKKLSTDSITAKLISLVIEECKKRNIRILAEGVETKEDYDLVVSMHVDEIQGYFYDKPMKPEDYIKKYLLV